MACAQDIFSHQVSEELYSCICEQQGEACIGRITKNFPEHWQKLWLMANRLVATPKSLTELGAFELLAVRNYLVLGLRVQQNKTIDPLMARMIAHGGHAGESAFSPEEGEAFRVWLIVAILTHISATRPQIVTQMEAPASDESLSIETTVARIMYGGTDPKSYMPILSMLWFADKKGRTYQAPNLVYLKSPLSYYLGAYMTKVRPRDARLVFNRHPVEREVMAWVHGHVSPLILKSLRSFRQVFDSSSALMLRYDNRRLEALGRLSRHTTTTMRRSYAMWTQVDRALSGSGYLSSAEVCLLTILPPENVNHAVAAECEELFRSENAAQVNSLLPEFTHPVARVWTAGTYSLATGQSLPIATRDNRRFEFSIATNAVPPRLFLRAANPKVKGVKFLLAPTSLAVMSAVREEDRAPRPRPPTRHPQPGRANLAGHARTPGADVYVGVDASPHGLAMVSFWTDPDIGRRYRVDYWHTNTVLPGNGGGGGSGYIWVRHDPFDDDAQRLLGDFERFVRDEFLALDYIRGKKISAAVEAPLTKESRTGTVVQREFTVNVIEALGRSLGLKINRPDNQLVKKSFEMFPVNPDKPKFNNTIGLRILKQANLLLGKSRRPHTMDQKEDQEEQKRQREGEEEKEDIDIDVSTLNLRSKLEKVRMYECWSLNSLPDLFEGAALSIRRVTKKTFLELMRSGRTKHPVSDIVDAMAIAHYGCLQDTSGPRAETLTKIGQLEPSTHTRIPTIQVLVLEPRVTDLRASEGGYSRFGDIPSTAQPSGVWSKVNQEGLDRHEIPNRDQSGIPLFCFLKRNNEELAKEQHRKHLEIASFRTLLMDMPRTEERKESGNRGVPETADVWDPEEYLYGKASYFILYLSNKTREDRISNGKSMLQGDEKRYKLGSIYDVTTGDMFTTKVWLNSGKGPDFHAISAKNSRLFVFVVRENETLEEQNGRRSNEFQQFSELRRKQQRSLIATSYMRKPPPQMHAGQPLS